MTHNVVITDGLLYLYTVSQKEPQKLKFYQIWGVHLTRMGVIPRMIGGPTKFVRFMVATVPISPA